MSAKLYNWKALLQAGIDPKTKQPLRLSKTQPELKPFLKIIDEADAINRYTWYNIPGTITSQELERMLYYKGQLAFFYIPELEEFYFMPYALDGTIDFYGRFNHIHPVPFSGGTTETPESKKQAEYLSTLRLKCQYAIKLDEEVDYETITNSAVLLHDYSKQLSETIIPREQVNDPLVELTSETLAFMRTALLSGTGILGVRVNDADQAQNVVEGSNAILTAALESTLYVPMIGNLDFQELSNGQLSKAEEYLLSAQAIDNLRLSGYGIDNGGLFQKKAHMLESEASMTAPSVGLVYQDGLSIRQNFCNIVNSIWDLGIWVEASESVIAADLDGDGKAYETNEDGANSGVDAGGENNDIQD